MCKSGQLWSNSCSKVSQLQSGLRLIEWSHQWCEPLLLGDWCSWWDQLSLLLHDHDEADGRRSDRVNSFLHCDDHALFAFTPCAHECALYVCVYVLYDDHVCNSLHACFDDESPSWSLMRQSYDHVRNYDACLMESEGLNTWQDWSRVQKQQWWSWQEHWYLLDEALSLLLHRLTK